MDGENALDARSVQREYMRRWRQEHPELVRAAQRRYWNRKAEQRRQEEAAQATVEKGVVVND